MSATRTKKETFLPYRYGKLGLELQVERATADGQPVDAGRIDAERKLVTLEGAWSSADVELSATVPSSLTSAVLPPEEHSTPSIDVVVAVTCADTRYRRGVLLAKAPQGVDFRFAGTVRLHRDELAGHVELQPFLIRSEPSMKRARGYAAHSGARLAGGRGWEVRVDRKRAPEGKYLDVRFKPFSADESIHERDRGNVWLLQYEQHAPILWLNADHPRLQHVLASEGTSGVAARAREVAFDQLAFPVWSQLLLRAIRDRYGDGEYAYDWQEGVVETLAKWMYPDKPTPSAQLAALEYESEELDRVLARLDRALQREFDFAAHLTKLIEEAER